MIPNSIDTTALFVNAFPAWEFGVDVTQQMETSVFVSRAGLEERQQRRQRCAWSIDWSSILSPASTAQRDDTARLEQAAPFIVPFWTERALTTSGIVANVVTIDRDATADWFTPGDYVLFVNTAGESEYRLIASVNGDELTLSGVGAGYTFGAGSEAFPCRRCIRTGQAAEWAPAGEAAIEPFRFATL